MVGSAEKRTRLNLATASSFAVGAGMGGSNAVSSARPLVEGIKRDLRHLLIRVRVQIQIGQSQRPARRTQLAHCRECRVILETATVQVDWDGMLQFKEESCYMKNAK
jgi:hypothetical protein